MKDVFDIPQADLRPPSQVMRLKRMGAMFPTRLSFLRSLMRFLSQEKTQVNRTCWEIDDDGFGRAVYTLNLGGHDYSLVAVSTYLPADQRTDRVIATAWDSAYVLYDGVPSQAEIDRIARSAPKQEAARFTERDLVLSRANKSVRLFSYVVDCLRDGRQPDEGRIRDTGYLMRTTAVYGNGKFGIADRSAFAARPGVGGPFAAEMLTVWLIRLFTHDLVEHMGGMPLDRELKRHLGIGNSTGLGMAPFLVNHPVLLNNWMLCKETALARVRAVEVLSRDRADDIIRYANRAHQHLAEWHVPDPEHQTRIDKLKSDWSQAQSWFDSERLVQPFALDALVLWSEEQSVDVQELMVALLLEPFGDLVDGLAECMADPFGALVMPFANSDALRAQVEEHCDWALKPDYSAKNECRQFWYVSAAKQEPRLGDRFEEVGAELESPLDIGRRIKAMYVDLIAEDDQPVTAFLSKYPEHALAVSRVGMTAQYPYGEIRDNLVGEQCLPIDMLRCKLSFFGASKFDPKSDRWTRITLCQGAPLADELEKDADDWWLPVFGG